MKHLLLYILCVIALICLKACKKDNPKPAQISQNTVDIYLLQKDTVSNNTYIVLTGTLTISNNDTSYTNTYTSDGHYIINNIDDGMYKCKIKGKISLGLNTGQYRYDSTNIVLSNNSIYTNTIIIK